MSNEPKVAYTFRTDQKPRFQASAKQDRRTISNTVNLAVKEFIARREIVLKNKESEDS